MKLKKLLSSLLLSVTLIGSLISNLTTYALGSGDSTTEATTIKYSDTGNLSVVITIPAEVSLTKPEGLEYDSGSSYNTWIPHVLGDSDITKTDLNLNSDGLFKLMKSTDIAPNGYLPSAQSPVDYNTVMEKYYDCMDVVEISDSPTWNQYNKQPYVKITIDNPIITLKDSSLNEKTAYCEFAGISGSNFKTVADSTGAYRILKYGNSHIAKKFPVAFFYLGELNEGESYSGTVTFNAEIVTWAAESF